VKRICSEKWMRQKEKGVAPKDHPGWCRVSDQLITGPHQKHQGGKVRKHVWMSTYRYWKSSCLILATTGISPWNFFHNCSYSGWRVCGGFSALSLKGGLHYGVGHPFFLGKRGIIFPSFPLFMAPHATATCCRICIQKWHGIEKGRALNKRKWILFWRWLWDGLVGRLIKKSV
jgi:hypothetical protein